MRRPESPRRNRLGHVVPAARVAKAKAGVEVMDFDSAILTLKVIGTIAPIAIYFLTLGVINSQASPRLVSGRWDFIILTGMFLPALFWPLGSLSSSIGWKAVLVLILPGVLALRSMLPHPWKHWVIYNADTQRAVESVRRAIEALGWTFQQESETLFAVPDLHMKIEVAGLGLLNAVNLHIRTDAKTPEEVEVASLIGAVEAALGRYQLLPTAAGLFLVLIGAGLMIVPMWLMTRHMRDIVEAIERLFVA